MNIIPHKIVICTPAIYSAGGVERVASFKANFFAEQLGYDVTIIVTEGVGRSCYFPLSDKVKVVNYELDFEELWQLPLFTKILIYLHKQHRYKKKLKADLGRIRPDFTISTLRREINFLTGIKDGSCKIGELHVNRANYRNVDGDNIIKRVFTYFWMKSLLGHLKQLDKMIVLTDRALEDWPELSNVVKIPDPLPFKIDVQSELNYKRIISISRYAYDKGNDLLLQVWSIIEKKFPEWSLDVFGNGDRKPYQKLLIELGIDQQRCHLYGPTTDVKKEYLSSSISLLSSRFEGFGLVIIESMACGVPVVSFDCENGPRSIITDEENGFLISPFDINAFAEKVILLMRNEELRIRMGANARKSVFQYDIDRVGLQWKQLFDELMQKNGV